MPPRRPTRSRSWLSRLPPRLKTAAKLLALLSTLVGEAYGLVQQYAPQLAKAADDHATRVGFLEFCLSAALADADPTTRAADTHACLDAIR